VPHLFFSREGKLCKIIQPDATDIDAGLGELLPVERRAVVDIAELIPEALLYGRGQVVWRRSLPVRVLVALGLSAHRAPLVIPFLLLRLQAHAQLREGRQRSPGRRAASIPEDALPVRSSACTRSRLRNNEKLSEKN
jgi:hypothetical protein